LIEDFKGNQIEEAFPSQPAIVLGFEKCPMVGEKFKSFLDFEKAKSFLKIEEKRPRILLISPEKKVFNLILKTDVLGSIEPIEEVISQIPQEKVILRILETGVGQINESDIKLAKSAQALILGFRVKTTPGAKILAQKEKIKIMNFEIIYDLVEGLRKFIERMLKPEIKRVDLGKIKTLVIFFTKKNRQIVGGRVIEGEVKKGTKIEVFRAGEKIGKGNLLNLQKNKRDIERAGKGEEVGILYEGDRKIEVGDTLLIYSEEKEKIEI
jgi:translation initiation factor IF-2